ncbi:FAD-dependent oxidoreductase [Alloiococcus sp. CFN-8]|uniref:FAD-dependent oxidoreductase n=1 Tax=Alloiococcus sp. CFN-8 TaxID=3416081 RepID=UPI003CEB0F97
MDLMYPKLMTPIRVGKHIVKNRIIAAPCTLHSASNGEPYPSEASINFFVQRAKAGAGIVVCAGVKLLPVTDDGEHASWDLYKHNSKHRIAELAEQIHFYGAKASMELIGIFEEGYVASEGGLLMDGRTPGREIPISEMMRYKEGYIHCAEELMNLGFDGILLHFGHSIPIAQFLSPLTNKRTDQYGGTFENRMRYIVEILEGIREKVGDKLFIEIRMSANEFKEGGIDTEEGIRIAEVLQRYADIVQASCGMITPENMCRTHPCDFLPPMPNVHLAEDFKKSGRINSFVTAIGGIGSLGDAEEIIASGKADFVAISRAFIADPELIPKAMEDNEEDIVPCIKCMRCHDSTVYGHLFQCSVNPTIGIAHKLDSMIPSVKKVKKVAIIGGGPAGMKAALVAASRGHLVTLYEKSSTLGGTLRFSSRVSFKYSLANYKDYLIKQIEKSNVNVLLNTKAVPEEMERENYDVIIAAIGAEPFIPPIEGIEYGYLATDIYGEEFKLGKNVIIVGGGQVGCETGLHLSRNGIQVTVLEMRDSLAPDASATHRGDLMAQLSSEKNLSTITEAKCKSIHPNGVTYEKNGKVHCIEADSIVIAAGMVPRSKEADNFIGIAPVYIPIGDCVKARTVEMATREGYFSAINL